MDFDFYEKYTEQIKDFEVRISRLEEKNGINPYDEEELSAEEEFSPNNDATTSELL